MRSLLGAVAEKWCVWQYGTYRVLGQFFLGGSSVKKAFLLTSALLLQMNIFGVNSTPQLLTTQRLCEKLADVFVDDFFLQLEDCDKKILLDSFLNKKDSSYSCLLAMPFEKGSLCFEVLQEIFYSMYMYVMTCQQGFYWDEMLLDFTQSINLNSVFGRKIKEIYECEVKKFRKEPRIAFENYLRGMCSENNISAEYYASLLVWEACRKIDQLREIILETLDDLSIKN